MKKSIKKQLLFITFITGIQLAYAQTHRDTVDIHHYNLNLDMSKSLSGFISGCAELELSLMESSNTFTLDLYGLTTDSVVINNTNVPFNFTDSTLTIQSQEAFSTNPFIVKIFYSGLPKKDPLWGGFFYDNTMAYNIGVGMGSYPHGIGRFWYPCNDAFTDRASYDIHLKTRLSEIGVASGILISDSSDNEFNYYHSMSFR